jgi:hypothetical protein
MTSAGWNRKERQRAEILSAVLDDRVGHALDLAFEHVAEFGEDQLVARVLCIAVAKRQDPLLVAELDALRRRASAPPEPGEPGGQGS